MLSADYTNQPLTPDDPMDFIERMVRHLHYSKTQPCIDGYWVLQLAEGHDLPDKIKRWARNVHKILVNPTREDSEKYMPRQTYRCDHQFDEPPDEDGYTPMLNDGEFWSKHEQRYQEWLRARR